MGKLLVQVIPLALGAAVSPALLTVAVLTLSSPRRGLARGLALTAGVLASLALLTGLGLTVLSHVTSHPSATRTAVSDAVDVTVGLVLLALALRALVERKQSEPGNDAPDSSRRPPMGLLATFGAGAALMVTNVTTILLYIPAMKDVAKSDVSDTGKAVATVIVGLITALPVLLPLAVRVAAPSASERWLGSLNATISRHHRAFIVGVEVVFGVYLLVKGL
jgi:threonine/homoserine/homoserine lactone efflux protein